jgi:hypothetical protein
MNNDKDSRANEFEAALVHGQILKIIRVYEQTVTSFAIQSCFRKAQLSPNTQTRPFKLEFNKETLHQNDEFNKFWDRNILVAALSRHWRIQRMGILNAKFLDA